MKIREKFFIAFCIVLAVATIWLTLVDAQVPGVQWSSPYRLSTGQGKASEGYLKSDQYGYVHIFWSELLSDLSTLILYSRFDGENWTTPTDIQLTGPFHQVGNMSPFVDQKGVLHLIWTDVLIERIFYSQAPANNATSAQNWSQPLAIDFPAKEAELLVDSKGVLHILYLKYGKDAGMYYIRSADQGISWSKPAWLDPEILPNHNPLRPKFVLDAQDGLHAVWSYIGENVSVGDWVRYFHSFDGGDTWSSFTIDKNEAGSEHLDAFADPILAVNGNEVHVIWGAGEQIYRHHRMSKDRGRTWGGPAQIFGSLNGHAGDGIAVDGSGRLHYFAQIRFPQAIYHAIWDRDHWITPTIIYLIRNTPFESIGDRVQAHVTHPAIRAGNQLVLTFADPPPDPERRLFVMYRYLDGIPQIPLTPTPTASPTLQPSPTPNPPTITPAANNLSQVTERDPGPAKAPSPGEALWLGVVTSLIFIIGIVSYNWLSRRRH